MHWPNGKWSGYPSAGTSSKSGRTSASRTGPEISRTADDDGGNPARGAATAGASARPNRPAKAKATAFTPAPTLTLPHEGGGDFTSGEGIFHLSVGVHERELGLAEPVLDQVRPLPHLPEGDAAAQPADQLRLRGGELEELACPLQLVWGLAVEDAGRSEEHTSELQSPMYLV